MEMRTIFFNGPKGPRWATTIAPTDENLIPSLSPTKPDDRAPDRRRFFGFLNTIRARLEQHGVSIEDVRRCYARRFVVKGMSACSQREWAIAAAEVQAMVQSPEVFSDRIARLRERTLDCCPAVQGASDSAGGGIASTPKISAIDGDSLDPSPMDSHPPQITFQEKLRREDEKCERAILKRLYAAPARIEDLDVLGFPKTLTNRVLHSLLHQDRVTFHGFTYFYHHLRALTEKTFMSLENSSDKNGEDRTVALKYTRIHESAIHQIGTQLSYSADEGLSLHQFQLQSRQRHHAPTLLFANRRVLGDYAQECLSRGRRAGRGRG